jgi:hypothetical protein
MQMESLDYLGWKGREGVQKGRETATEDECEGVSGALILVTRL